MARARSRITAVGHLLDVVSVPVYVVDDQRRIIYCNPALATWLGSDPNDLLGLQCNYHTDISQTDGRHASNACVAGLCPAPAAFTGQSSVGSVLRMADNQFDERPAVFIPLGHDVASCVGVLVVCDVDDTTTNDRRMTLDMRKRLTALRRAMAESFQNDAIVGDGPKMRQVRSQVAVAANNDVRVVVIGPPGSGREHLARTIHMHGRRENAAPLVPLDCALLDAELLQTTISGFLQSCAELETEHVPCLLLLEVDRLPLDAQSTLVELLEVRELGVRTIATARDALLDLAKTDGFRADLGAALSTMEIRLPAIRDRLEEVALLCQYFIEQCNAKGGKQVDGFSDEAIEVLQRFPWTRNIDEIRETVFDAHTLAKSTRICVDALPARIRLGVAADGIPEGDQSIDLDMFLENIERELLRRALMRSGGNKAQAARLLGVSRARLLRRIAHLGIQLGTEA